MRVRIRRIAKWGCLSLGSVMLIAAVVGYWWNVSLIGWILGNRPREALTFAVGVRGIGISTLSGYDMPSSGLQWFSDDASYPPRLWPMMELSSTTWGLMIPMSNLALLTLSGALILWRLDRRRAAHECPKCRYDRRGLAEGAVCPECGAG